MAININRRCFISRSAVLAAGSILPSYTFAAHTGFIIGASRLSETQFAVSKVNLNGRLQWQTELPSRGHDVILNEESGRGIAVARRPETYIFVFDIISGEKIQQIEVNKKFKLNGHAVWQGNKLIVSGSERDSSHMTLFEYQWYATRKSLQFKSHYKFNFNGPHELVLNGDNIWVAVGGLKTKGRDVLNKQSLVSGLLKLNANDFSVKEFYRTPYRGLSLRHLDINNGSVYIAGQYQLDSKESPPLLFKLIDDELAPFDTESTLWSRLKGYIGSIKIVNDKIIATCPRSHWLGSFNVDTLKLEDQLLSSDICALAANGQFIAGTGAGKLIVNRENINSKVVWDNHFVFSNI